MTALEFSVSNKIFVGGLDFSLDENFLRKEFSKFGLVRNVKLCKDIETDKSRGFAFITFMDSSSAENAIKEMDGKQLGSRFIGVSMAIEKKRPIHS